MQMGHISGLCRAEILLFVGPITSPSRSRYHDSAVRDIAVRRLPFLQIIDTEHSVRIFGGASREIDNSGRPDQFCERHLVDSCAVLVEMDWRIHVSATMFGRGKLAGR